MGEAAAAVCWWSEARPACLGSSATAVLRRVTAPTARAVASAFYAVSGPPDLASGRTQGGNLPFLLGGRASICCLRAGGLPWLTRQQGMVVVPARAWRCDCAGVCVGQWSCLHESTGVNDPSESLAGSCWPAVAAPVGVAFFLGGAVEVIWASCVVGSRS